MRKGRTYHHGDLRRALLDATVELVERGGQDSFTLRAAAKRAGVSDGAPYHHFPDKRALLAAVAAEGFSLLHDAMVTAASRQKGSRLEKGRAVAVAYVRFATERAPYFRIMFGGAWSDVERYPELAHAASRALALIQEHLVVGLAEAAAPQRKGTRSARATKAPAEARAPSSCAHWALVHGLSCLAMDGHLGAAARDARALSRLTAGALGALRAG